MTTRDPLVLQMWTASVGLFNQGVNDPSAEEIAREVWPQGPLTPSMIKDVRMKLGRLRSELEAQRTDSGEEIFQVCPLSEVYYREFRMQDTASLTDVDVRRCLAVGSGNSEAGILRLTGSHDTDRMWLAWQQIKGNRAAGATKIVRDSVLEAVQDRKIGKRDAHDVLEDANVRSMPKPHLRKVAGRVAAAIESR